ncbi:amino acid ABC transporter ATP-binding protein [Blastochloris viridis]|nr:amino acid ABC transporter [Blastochloris viridis]
MAPETALSEIKPKIEFRHVHKHHGALHVIQGVSTTVRAGEVVVICGPSGSGKSTLIRLINGLETISEGEVLVDGIAVSLLRGRALQALRSRIGFVFQQFNLYAHLTAEENVSLAPRRIGGLTKAAARQCALALLERVGLSDKTDAFPHQLSGGQQQRVAIARALALDPDIVLFDEPTSALDPEMIGEVLIVMREVARSGITMVVVTHEMGFARQLADRVLFLDEGEILEEASPERFFLAPSHPRARRFLSQIHSPLHLAEVE